jgi:hypothetical protein
MAEDFGYALGSFVAGNLGGNLGYIAFTALVLALLALSFIVLKVDRRQRRR